MTKRRIVLRSALGAVALTAGCLSSGPGSGPVTQITAAVGLPPPDETPLDPGMITKFANQLPILPVWQPTVIRNSSGR